MNLLWLVIPSAVYATSIVNLVLIGFHDYPNIELGLDAFLSPHGTTLTMDVGAFDTLRLLWPDINTSIPVDHMERKLMEEFQSSLNLTYYTLFVLNLPNTGYCQPSTLNASLHNLNKCVPVSQTSWLSHSNFAWSHLSPDSDFQPRVLQTLHSLQSKVLEPYHPTPLVTTFRRLSPQIPVNIYLVGDMTENLNLSWFTSTLQTLSNHSIQTLVHSSTQDTLLNTALLFASYNVHNGQQSQSFIRLKEFVQVVQHEPTFHIQDVSIVWISKPTFSFESNHTSLGLNGVVLILGDSLDVHYQSVITTLEILWEVAHGQGLNGRMDLTEWSLASTFPPLPLTQMIPSIPPLITSSPSSPTSPWHHMKQMFTFWKSYLPYF